MYKRWKNTLRQRGVRLKSARVEGWEEVPQVWVQRFPCSLWRGLRSQHFMTYSQCEEPTPEQGQSVRRKEHQGRAIVVCSEPLCSIPCAACHGDIESEVRELTSDKGMGGIERIKFLYFFLSVYIFYTYFLSVYLSTYLQVNWANFPQVKLVLPVMLTGKWSPWISQPMSISFFYLPPVLLRREWIKWL